METWFVWGIIPISPQVIPLYLHIRNEKIKVLSVYKLSMIEQSTYKVRNEIETKRNEINENETKRN